VHNALGEVNMLPSKPKKLTTTHSCFDCKNYKLLQQWRSSPVTRSKEALFFAIFETAFTSLRDALRISLIVSGDFRRS
jgi:hypothetical protein